MYFFIVVAFMLVLPVASILIELIAGGSGDIIFLIGKWFVFWSVGVRLFTAGLRQIFRPEFTAQTIFQTSDPGALKIVPELGFSNVAAGVVAIASLYFPGWIMPIAVYGVLFYGLAAAKHVTNRHRNRLENIALASDAWIALVLAFIVVASVLR